MLLNYVGENWDDDALAVSIETRIFKDVFFGYDLHDDTDDNRGLLGKTSQVESCNASQDLKENISHWCSSEGDALFFKCNNSGPYSLEPLPKSGPSKRIISGISLPTAAVAGDSVMCQLVESTPQGIASSCFLMKRPAENDVREVDAKKAFCFSVSQESSANKLMVANNFVTQRSVEKSILSKFSNGPVTQAVGNTDCMNNLKPFLRSHVQDLLTDAGWEIGRRKREKIRGEFLYYTPWKRKPIRDFRRVWNLCGRKLFTDANVFLEESDKQWADMTDLWSDLTNTITATERERNGKNKATALAQRWYLLDPFVNMVFIDKKLDTLKAGISVKVRRSLVMGTFKDDVLLPSDYPYIYGNQFNEASEHQISDASVVNRDALTIFNLEKVGTKRSRLNMGFSEACDRDSTCVYPESCLFDVPITYEDAKIISAGSETSPPSHDPHNFTPSFCKRRSYYDEEFDFKSKQQKSIICFEAGKTLNEQKNENTGHQFENSYLMDLDIKVMEDLALIEQVEQSVGLSASKSKVALTKLDTTSGNRLITLDHSTRVSRSCEPEQCDIKRGNSLLEQSGAEGCCIAASGCTTKICRTSFMKSSYQWKGRKQEVKMENSVNPKERLPRHPTWQLKGDNVGFSASRKNKSFGKGTKVYAWKIKSFISEAQKQHKLQKASCRLVPRSSVEGNKHIEGESPVFNVRTVLTWLIDRGFISLGENIQCISMKDDSVLKDGLITRDGVICKCCGFLLSVSKFRSHAGSRMIHPSLVLVTKSGKSFTACQLEALSAEYKARESSIQPVKDYGLDSSDDKCGLCGDMGELICCDSCPSTFHQACLETQELPEGSWYCMHCSCRVCGDLVDDKTPRKSHLALTCLQCEHKYHMACLQERGRVVPFDNRFCCQSCQEVYTTLTSHIGSLHQLSDGFSYSLLKCTHDDQRGHYYAKIAALEAECNSKLAVALTIMEEGFFSIVDSRTGIDMIPHVLYNWRSEYPRLNYNGFYTVVLEKDDMLFSVASIRIHGVAVAEMPLVATCSIYQRQGMFRRLLHSIEEMLKCLKVEKLVVSALPSLVETWTVSFGFTLMEDDERNSLRNFNLMVFPGTVWLKKHICGSRKTLQSNAGAWHSSFSVTNSRACFRERPVSDPQKHIFRRYSRNETSKKREMRQIGPKGMQMVHDDQHGSLYKHLLKLPWGEPDSSVGRIRVDVGAARESALRISQKAHALQDTC